MFTEVSDPLEVDNWLHITESNFGFLHCTEFQKTLYVAQQLCGPASAWWVSYSATLQDGHQVPWAEFCQAFRGYNLPMGLMACKLQEFLLLQQGSGSVYEYSKRFNHRLQYDSYHTDTHEKKMAMFRQGLSPVLQEHLMMFWGCSLNELVNASIEQEDTCRAHIEEERKTRPLSGATWGAPPKYCLVYTTPSGQPRGPHPPQQWSHHPPQQVAPHLSVYAQQVAPPQAPQPAGVGFPCFNCGRTGHFA
jgi:hypothetical protein